MSVPRKILVAVDGSESSEAAVNTAVELGEAFGATVTVLEVIEDFGPLPGVYDAAPEGVERTPWLADARFETARARLERSPITWSRRVEEGYAAEEICRAAEEEDSDLIIVGSRGLSAVGRFLVGSVSDKVVHHAPCSVLVVRPETGSGPELGIAVGTAL